MALIQQLLSVLSVFVTQATCSAVLVKAPAGTIEGKIATDSNNNKYYVFQGVPYALPPVGDLRFAKPQPRPKFEETFSATKEPTSCPQYGPYSFVDPNGREDCLILNIYTNELQPDVKKKVLVFVHGGGFVMGSSKIANPDTFAATQGIITITIQYRLGIFGFLSTDDEIAPGNFGLWDQVLALKWVKDNIAAFGGDPKDVTFTGESAGGASVSLLSLSPAAQGLFKKVYPHSGTATSTFAHALTPQNDMLRFAKHVGCWDGDVEQRIHSSQSAEIIKCLRLVPFSKIQPYADPSLTPGKFVPVVDDELIPKSPIELIKDKDYLRSIGFFDKAYLVAIDNNEAGFASTVLSMLEAITQKLSGSKPEEKERALLDLRSELWKYYVSSRVPRADNSTVAEIKDWYSRRYYDQEALIQIMTDLWFLVPTYDIIDSVSTDENAKVWLLSFDYYPRFMKGQKRGIVHGIDLVYWLDMSLPKLESILHAGIKGRMDQEDKELKQSFSTIIADFVKAGDPGTTLSSKMGGKWPKYDSHNAFYLSFKTNPTVEQGLHLDKRQFWLKRS